MNSIARESLLYDLYGSLLTDKKRTVMECYHEDDMSLGEIADDMGISRAAVHDSLKSAEAQLEQYEKKLGLLARYEKASMLADEADSIISGLESKTTGAELTRLREIIAELAEPGI
ncbi:MAG: YlxM family DNA-binding protein [Eubacterium sp.]|nr:YlxM family DNA-binding protein [Eubacterium sp.]